MAANPTVTRGVPARKSIRIRPECADNQTLQPSELKPAHGVITLTGYGISVCVDRGHLVLDDGIGNERRRARLPRVAHGLKRLVVVGSDGHVSLSALRWLADQKASFTMLGRDGSVLFNTGPVRPSEAKLRRAQALALQNGVGFRLSREIIDRKLAGQQEVVVEALGDLTAAVAIREIRSELAEVESIDALRLVESKGAKVYWSAWRSLPIAFPRKDLPHVPDHWQIFGARVSPLTGSPRLAANPVNAILNYLYAILEAESRLAAATLGLDPGIGVLHVDTPSRDSLACDLMEPIRPEVDKFVFDWLKSVPLSRSNFFEERDGNCRLMAQFAERLSQTAPTWARLVAPVAEWFAQELFRSSAARPLQLPARLTQRHRREAKGADSLPRLASAVKPTNVCRTCGKELDRRSNRFCVQCGEAESVERMAAVAQLGREVSHGARSEAKRSATQKINTQAAWDWDPSSNPNWLTADFYSKNIRPRLQLKSSSAIGKLLGVSRAYANEVRKGRMPHPRHWMSLAELTRP
jgi:CRISPR-associated endonuclease Cas1